MNARIVELIGMRALQVERYASRISFLGNNFSAGDLIKMQKPRLNWAGPLSLNRSM